ncbi:hypothetical protein Vafri_21276, partial [Volvox africanus]
LCRPVHTPGGGPLLPQQNLRDAISDLGPVTNGRMSTLGRRGMVTASGSATDDDDRGGNNGRDGIGGANMMDVDGGGGSNPIGGRGGGTGCGHIINSSNPEGGTAGDSGRGNDGTGSRYNPMNATAGANISTPNVAAQVEISRPPGFHTVVAAASSANCNSSLLHLAAVSATPPLLTTPAEARKAVVYGLSSYDMALIGRTGLVVYGMERQYRLRQLGQRKINTRATAKLPRACAGALGPTGHEAAGGTGGGSSGSGRQINWVEDARKRGLERLGEVILQNNGARGPADEVWTGFKHTEQTERCKAQKERILKVQEQKAR